MKPFKHNKSLNWSTGRLVRICPQKLQDILNLSTGGSVTFSSQQLQEMSSVDNWNHVQLFYASRKINFVTIKIFLFFQRDYDTIMLPDRCILMWIIMLINHSLLLLFYTSHKKRFLIMLTLSLWIIMLIWTLWPLFTYIHNTNKQITTKYYIQLRQVTSGDIYWQSYWKGGCKGSYTSSTYY